MDNPRSSPEVNDKASQFQVNLDDPWECKFLARHLGVTEEALVVAAGGGGRATTVEELCQRLAEG